MKTLFTKKLLTLFFCTTLLLPLYAQEGEFDAALEAELNEHILEARARAGELEAASGEEGGEEGADFEDARPGRERKPRKPRKESWALTGWNFGTDIGLGFNNSLFAFGEFFTENVVIDAEKLKKSIGKNGADINLELPVNLLEVNVMGIPIAEETMAEALWDFGFSFGTEGRLNINIPQSFFTLISEGNLNKDSIEGKISAAGGIYAVLGLSASAQFKNLNFWASFKPSVFSPLVFVPRSGIGYSIVTTDDSITIDMHGAFEVYSPILSLIDGTEDRFNTGADFTLEGGYHLFDFLDVGASLINIPLGPARMESRMRIAMDMEEPLVIDNILGGLDGMDDPKIATGDPVYDKKTYKVFRPFRFDVNATYKPPFNTGAFSLFAKPNIGFSVDGNDSRGYFNAGVEGLVNLNHDMFLAYLNMGRTEGVWRHRLGINLNLRAAAFYLEGSLQSQSFAKSFSGGFGLNLGWRFGF